MSRPLYKTTLEIWTEDDPAGWDVAALGREASQGNGMCLGWSTDLVEDPTQDPSWDDEASNFFFFDEEDES